MKSMFDQYISSVSLLNNAFSILDHDNSLIEKIYIFIESHNLIKNGYARTCCTQH